MIGRHRERGGLRKGERHPCQPFGKILLLASVMSIGQVHADTIWMANGDRLSGEIRRLDAGRLHLMTSYGGDLDLDWNQVEAIESVSELPIRNEGLRAEYRSRLRGENELERTGAAVPVNEVSPSTPPAAALQSPSIWNRLGGAGKLGLGLNRRAASSRTEEYTATLDNKWWYQGVRYKLNAYYMRKSSNAVTTSNNHGLALSSDHFVSDQLFWQGRASYKKDQVEDLSRQLALGAGPGYQFWDDETGGFSLAGLVGLARYDYSHDVTQRFLATSLRWDYNRFMSGDRLELYTTGELMRPLDHAVDLSIDAVVGLRYRMTDWLSWFMSYSRNQVSGGRQSLNERRVSSGLEVNW